LLLKLLVNMLLELLLLHLLLLSFGLRESPLLRRFKSNFRAHICIDRRTPVIRRTRRRLDDVFQPIVRDVTVTDVTFPTAIVTARIIKSGIRLRAIMVGRPVPFAANVQILKRLRRIFDKLSPRLTTIRFIKNMMRHRFLMRNISVCEE
jgi:hypothetical protein